MKLTLSQQDVYFEQLLFPNDPIYNIGAKIEIKGAINVAVFKEAYKKLIDQHDTYRSILLKNQEDVSMKVIEEHQSELGWVDFSTADNAAEQAAVYMRKEFTKPFDLFDEKLLHVFTLVKVSDSFHYLFSVYHHIITDGWGTSLMFQRLVQNYNEILEFGEVKTAYPFSYKDFAEDDFDYQNSVSFAEDKAYWVEKFAALPEALLEKESASIKNINQVNKSSRKELIIKRELYNELNQLAAAYKSSSFHLILAVLYTYFGRKHQNNDFAIGLPVLNRSKAIYKKTVGLFMGVSPLRIPLDFEATFEDLVLQIKNQLRQDYRHQRFPLGKLIQELQAFKEKEKIFNITLSYEKQNYATNFAHTQTRVIPLTHESERVALAIYIREFDEQEDVKIDFDYNVNYFNDLEIKQVVSHFQNLLKHVLAHPDKKLKEFTYLTAEENNQILVGFNDTETAYPKDKTFLDLFHQQVEQFPGKEALCDDLRSYSYAELNKVSNQIAEYLIASHGKKDKSPIAVLLERSANMVVILLGILKSGRPYIPLDPTFPEERLNYIIGNSQSKLLINEKEYSLNTANDEVVISAESIFEILDSFKGASGKPVSPNNTAYIIYTSGSTGNPKGVEIGHQSLLNFLTSIQIEPGVSAKDLFFSVTTYSFDISILEFFTPLIAGATLYMANHEVLSDPYLVIEKLKEVQPTVIQATPSFYQMLFHADWQGDKRLKVLCGGDLLSETLAEKLVDNCLEIWNMYGPTETTIWSSQKKIEQPNQASNIGKPINNTQFYILDQFLNPKPIGTTGAIYIAGDGLAKGYYKNEELSKEKFIANPFSNASLLYETGDVGKWNSEGEIEFLGRNDNQVKIRGYRIELGDIETQLNQIEGIENAVVLAKKGNQQEAFLVAFILKNDNNPEEQKINTILKANLPYYMIPHSIITLEKFPLTPNQKVDRKALLQLDIQQNISEADFTAPTSDLEKKLAYYWKQVLHTKESISVNDNFFALGGHSLNAVKLIGLVSKELSFTISLKTIFDYPTIETLANHLQDLKQDQAMALTTAETKSFYNVTPSQYNIWLASQQEKGSIAYNMSAAYHVTGTLNVQGIEDAIKKIISKYEILRTNFIEIDGLPFQKINPIDAIQFNIAIDQVKSENIDQKIEQLLNTAFDLETAVLLRVNVLQLENDQFVLLFATHHIVMDGLSLEIFIEAFIQNYNSSENLAISTEDHLQFQFKDYSEWFNRIAEEQAVKNELFWENYLEDYRPEPSFDHDSSSANDHQNGGKFLFELTTEDTLALKETALKEQVTLYTILMAALNVLIYKFSNHNDICIGTVNSGRTIPELNNQIGMFAKTMVLRTKIEPEQTFVTLLKNTQDNLLEVNEYQDVPLTTFSKSVFDVLLVYQNPEFSFGDIEDLKGFKLTTYPIDNKYSRLSVVFNFFESDHKLKAIVDYNADLFDENTIEIITQKFSKILEQAISNPSIEVGGIDASLGFEKNTAFDFEFNF
ncbi:non-ribosomal peptide synthetase [Flavobacterium hercynium]|uniref:Non-ribosomal peptide synthetase n=1 Tax=Flavobacterium hercynium TaxID=387094 RepID=A0A226H826_9FLAO|nr:non-ribosomal peptide synthetase [Flavobacterium hercynium]OXA89998.1 non-ribosomal peptide synthetase [Flavobacterium hercynium]SMP14210.1 amino acid adenylation domain-containing protein [Flavobacterium hercynium]